jgi:hypothetical protein
VAVPSFAFVQENLAGVRMQIVSGRFAFHASQIFSGIAMHGN